MKNWAEVMLNFGIRAVFGMIAVYLINSWMSGVGMEATVGINPFSFMITGFLGVPGVALLYGLRFYFL